MLTCIHIFCGSCLKREFAERSVCPQCRGSVQGTTSVPFVNESLDAFLVQNPHKARSETEKAEIARFYTPGETITGQGATVRRSVSVESIASPATEMLGDDDLLLEIAIAESLREGGRQINRRGNRGSVSF